MTATIDPRIAYSIATIHHLADTSAMAPGEMRQAKMPIGYITGACSIQEDLTGIAGVYVDELSDTEIEEYEEAVCAEYADLCVAAP